MYTPEKNYEIIIAIIKKNTPLFIDAVRNDQSVKGASEILRTSNDPKLNAMIVFTDAMDSQFVSREKTADILKNSFSPVRLEILATVLPEKLAEAVKAFSDAIAPSKIPV